jgi:serine/threonine-protein kinase HipA
MFDGKKVSHILDFEAPSENETVAEQFRQNTTNISISGVQFKQSLLLEKNKLRLTFPGEQGRYILKPIPFNPPFGMAGELAANEHLTMQIARQAFGIATAECALVFFQNGLPAYITRRFDYTANGDKISQEDFATLSGKSKGHDGDNYRTQGSYQDIAMLMKRYIPAYPIEIEKFFEQILFNYLFSNGDAHLKNFSILQTLAGDYMLSPAYDLINTSIHIPSDSFFALDDGLFCDGHETESFKHLGFYAYDDFFEFGRRIGLIENRTVKLLNKYRTKNPKAMEMIKRSFLSPQARVLYESHLLDRQKMLNISFSNKIQPK